MIEQALPGALAAGQEMERQLATTSLEFENLHQKSRLEISGDNISKTSSPLARVSQCLFTFALVFT